MDAVDEIRRQQSQGGQQRAADVVKGKLGAAPHPLQGLPQPVVEDQGDDQPDTPVCGQQHIGDEPPELPMKYAADIQGQEIQGPGAGEEAQDVQHGVSADNIPHQARDRQLGVQGAEAVNGIV